MEFITFVGGRAALVIFIAIYIPLPNRDCQSPNICLAWVAGKRDSGIMLKVLDPGHQYQLLTLDGDEFVQTLTFVKRMDLEHPEKYPGNTSTYPGTTIQSVVRCLIERIDYLQNQIPHENNVAIKDYLLSVLWLLEDRAAERHGRDFDYRPEDMVEMPMCPHCGHVVCKELGNSKK